MDNLTYFRIIIFTLGMLGLPLALSLLELSWYTANKARRKSVRYTSRLFFWLTAGIAFLLAGEAIISGWLLLCQAEQSLLPAIVHIGAMLIFDAALLGMLWVNRFIEKEVKRYET